MAHHCDDGCSGHSSVLGSPEEIGVAYSLYSKIIMDELETLNEVVDGSGKTVFRPWDQRLEREKFCESDCDEELLFKVPFSGNVKLKGIIIAGDESDTHPSRVRLYKNKPNMTFEDTTLEPDQEFECIRDPTGITEYPLKIVRFSSVHHLTIHIPKNYGDPTTKVYYIGLRGEFTPAARSQIVIANYELRPNAADCKPPIQETNDHTIF